MLELVASLKIESIYLLRILFAGICGLVLGYERKRRQKEAGLRTHFVVSTASALMMVVSISFTDDAARIAAQIVSGIGFLGAGMIFFRRETLHGLTTAAGIWATSGIGMAAGAGLYLVAIGGTIIIVVGQTVMHSKLMSKKNDYQLLSVKFDYTPETIALLKQYFGVEVFSRFKAEEGPDGVVAEAVIRTRNDCGADSLVSVLLANKNIHSVERLEDL